MERSKHTRALGQMNILTPYREDGIRTRALLAEIEAWMSARPEGVEIEDWEARIKDKIPVWRERLRSARYLDWKDG